MEQVTRLQSARKLIVEFLRFRIKAFGVSTLKAVDRLFLVTHDKQGAIALGSNLH